MKFISKLLRRGVLYTVAMTVYRFIPAWLFRFTVMDVLELDWKTMEANDSRTGTPGLRNVGQSTLCSVTDRQSREQLRELTLVGTIDVSQDRPWGFGVKDNSTNQLVGGLWIGADRNLESAFGFAFHLPENAGWLFAAMIQKQHRGNGTYNELLEYSLRTSAEQGTQPVYAAVSPCHHAAVHAHGKACRRKVGRLYALRILGFAWIRSTGSLATERGTTFHCQDSPNVVRIVPDESPNGLESLDELLISELTPV